MEATNKARHNFMANSNEMSSMIKIFFLALAFIIPTASVAMEDDLESIPPINSELELARADVPANCCSRGIWRTLACVGAWRQFFHQNRAQDRNEVLRDAAMNQGVRRAIGKIFYGCKLKGSKVLCGLMGVPFLVITAYSWYEVYVGPGGRACSANDACVLYYLAGMFAAPVPAILFPILSCLSSSR